MGTFTMKLHICMRMKSVRACVCVRVRGGLGTGEMGRANTPFGEPRIISRAAGK